jgi:multiple sugar transport system ATP-binding protein
MSAITLCDVTKRFGTTTALDSLSLAVADGEFFVILGPSGAGKTTALRIVAGLEKPDSGRVLKNGIDITALHTSDRDVAFVFQQYSLYPHLNVRQNIEFPLKAPGRRLPAEEMANRIARVASLLHIEHKLDKPCTKLSGGEMQRVAIARALVRQPSVFLMDEPLSSLDAKLREELRVELRSIQEQLGATVIYVTHDQVEALTMADRIAVLEDGEIRQIGTPHQVYDRPDSLAVARRLGTPPINVLPPSWFGGGLPSGTVHVGVRPEDVVAEESRNGQERRFTVIECSPLSRTLVAESEQQEVRAVLPPDLLFTPGSQVTLSFPAANRHHFDAAGRRLSA